MTLKTLIAAGVAAAFALPLSAQAQSGGSGGSDAASGGGGSGSSATVPGAANTTNAPAPGSSRPSGAASGASSGTSGMSGMSGMSSTSFSELDKNNDGSISRAEWDAHMGRAGAGSSSEPVGAGHTPSSGSVNPTNPGTGRGIGQQPQNPGRN